MYSLLSRKKHRWDTTGARRSCHQIILTLMKRYFLISIKDPLVK
jgi:hypothetical protein